MIAEREGASILSTDSMLIYKGMNIGTAKPSPEELRAVSYYGVDLVTPSERFSTGQYLGALKEGEMIPKSSTHPIISAGGTGLYIRALIEGLDATTPSQLVTRERLQQLFDDAGVVALQDELRQRFPDWIETLADANNPRRLIRAIERAEAGESPKSAQVRSKPKLVGLHVERENLLIRIHDRVEQMYEVGLIDEVEQLRAAYPVWSETACAAIGYREACDYLDGACGLDKAKERTRIRTAQLAKRQRTWLRNQCHMEWVDCDRNEDVEHTIEKVYGAWEKVGPTKLGF